MIPQPPYLSLESEPGTLGRNSDVLRHDLLNDMHCLQGIARTQRGAGQSPMPMIAFPHPIDIWSVGHSNQSLADLVALLRAQMITTIIDVRSAPYSQFVPHFNRAALQPELPSRNIVYRLAGGTLGGRPSDPTCYKTGVLPEERADYLELVHYSEVAQRDWFRESIAQVVDLATP